MGVVPGIPDICVPIARKAWHGLYLEFKTKKGRVSPEQKNIHALMTEQQYKVVVVRSAQEAQGELENYLGLKL